MENNTEKTTLYDKLVKLLNVKTIITLVGLGLWIYVTTTGIVEGEFFKTIFTMIISFYFGTQFSKDTKETK